MIQIIRYIRGYLTIRVWGFSPERFMNLCSNHNILLWDIVGHGNDYTMNISLQGFYRLRGIARKTGTRVVITNRYGLPFLSKRMWRRRIFLAGLAGSLAFWIWMSGFVWSVEIEGNYHITTDVFMDFLEENGTRAGMKKKQVDMEALEGEIRDQFQIVTWVSAQMKGTRLLIRVKENDLAYIGKGTSQETETKEGMDLRAGEDGIVFSIVTRQGIPRVRAGMQVQKGDVLVEGAIPIYQDDGTVGKYEFCVADADVVLQYVVTEKERLSTKYQYKNYTGKQKKRYFLMLGEKKLQLPEGRKFAYYDVLEERRELFRFGGYRLPVFVGCDTVREYYPEEKIYTREEVRKIFEEKLQKIIETFQEKGVQIIEKNVTINKTSKQWQLKTDFLVRQRSGILQKTELTQIVQDETDTEAAQ